MPVFRFTMDVPLILQYDRIILLFCKELALGSISAKFEVRETRKKKFLNPKFRAGASVWSDQVKSAKVGWLVCMLMRIGNVNI